MAARVLLVAVLIAAAAVGGFYLGSQVARGTNGSAADAKRDFMFQVAGYQTANQGGQTLNVFIHYRYDRGIATENIPNYIDLRTQVLDFLNGVDAGDNPYWETLNQEICTQLSENFPIEAISCQLQVLSDDRPGLPYEPGFHTSIHTIGDIDPLAIPGPIGSPDALGPSETLTPGDTAQPSPSTT